MRSKTAQEMAATWDGLKSAVCQSCGSKLINVKLHPLNAVAPELLEAATLALVTLEGQALAGGHGPDLKPAIIGLRVALAKAMGGTHKGDCAYINLGLDCNCGADYGA